MLELVEFLVGSLVDDKSALKVELSGDVINVTVSKEDMGKLIGQARAERQKLCGR